MLFPIPVTVLVCLNYYVFGLTYKYLLEMLNIYYYYTILYLVEFFE